MNDMITLGNYIDLKKEYFNRINNQYLMPNINEYGIKNVILNIFLREDITGISDLDSLFNILENKRTTLSDSKILRAKKGYLSHLLRYYVTDKLENFYDDNNITDQDIDCGSTISIDVVSNYVKNQTTSRMSR
jgi:hypothetical protein